jgi:hypothetical protein
MQASSGQSQAVVSTAKILKIKQPAKSAGCFALQKFTWFAPSPLSMNAASMITGRQ